MLVNGVVLSETEDLLKKVCEAYEGERQHHLFKIVWLCQGSQVSLENVGAKQLGLMLRIV